MCFSTLSALLGLHGAGGGCRRSVGLSGQKAALCWTCLMRSLDKGAFPERCTSTRQFKGSVPTVTFLSQMSPFSAALKFANMLGTRSLSCGVRVRGTLPRGIWVPPDHGGQSASLRANLPSF